MLSKVDAFLSAQPPWRLTVFSLVLVAIVGVVDHLTGYELSFSIYYLIPVGIGSWYLQRHTAMTICTVSAFTWFVLDYTSGHHYSHPAIPFWNAGVRLGTFVIVALLLGRLRSVLALNVALAELDGLTGIMNARTFHQRCESFFELAKRHKHPLALGFLDLDGFKGINDRLGHSVGDQVLKAVAVTLSNRLRASDICARLGGDEFSVLLPNTNAEGARAFFTELHFSLVDLATANDWPVGFSVGVAVFQSPTGSAGEAIRCADSLMYEVKSSGKNNVRVAEFGDGRGVGERARYLAVK